MSKELTRNFTYPIPMSLHKKFKECCNSRKLRMNDILNILVADQIAKWLLEEHGIYQKEYEQKIKEYT